MTDDRGSHATDEDCERCAWLAMEMSAAQLDMDWNRQKDIRAWQERHFQRRHASTEVQT